MDPGKSKFKVLEDIMSDEGLPLGFQMMSCIGIITVEKEAGGSILIL